VRLKLRRYACAYTCSGSGCARLIDFAESNRQQRDVDAADLIRHAAEEYAAWLEVPDIRS
jgi:hypothetical protein